MSAAGYRQALIVGAGAGLSASLTRQLAAAGLNVALAARSPDDLSGLVAETGAKVFACDASEDDQVARLFADIDAAIGAPDVVIYNASFRTRGDFIELLPSEVARTLAVSAFGAFLVA